RSTGRVSLQHRFAAGRSLSGSLAVLRESSSPGYIGPDLPQQLAISGQREFLFRLPGSAVGPIAPLCRSSRLHDLLVSSLSTRQLRLVQALSHPLRIFILGSLEESSRTSGSLAGILDVDQYVLAYHLK